MSLGSVRAVKGCESESNGMYSGPIRNAAPIEGSGFRLHV